MPRVSIILVTHNSRDDLEACLRSLTEHPPRVEHDILIVDNASTDGTPAYVREHWPALRLTDAGGNLGFAKANNLGIRHTSGELVLVLNPDTIVPAGVLDELVAFLDTHPEVAIAGPRIVDRHGRAELSFGSMISPLAELKQKLLVVGSDRGLAFIRGLVDRMTRRSREVDWVSGACFLARRADLEAVGLFDERFFLYTEDVDLCASVRDRGRRVHFLAGVEIVHRRGRSGLTAPQATNAAYQRSHIAFYGKHHPRWVPVLTTYLKLRGRLPGTK